MQQHAQENAREGHQMRKLRRVIDSHYNRSNDDSSTCPQIWDDLRREFSIPIESSISTLFTNEWLIFSVVRYLMDLPFTINARKIISTMVQHCDPSRCFLKKLIEQLVPCLQQGEYCLNMLNVCLFTLNRMFQQQTPTNSNLDSCIMMHGGEGIILDKKVSWPFERSGTITMWYNMREETKECKLFELVNSEKAGFQVVLKNRKIYFRKLSEDNRFRLMKNNSAYLCEAVYGQNVKLCIEFEIKKGFFKPSFFINVIMNNFLMNNIEVDSLSYVLNEFSLSLFRGFHGKVYSVLLLSLNLSGQVEEFNSRKGFIYENDIKNFASIFENEIKNIYMLLSAIRAITVYEGEDQENIGRKDMEDSVKLEDFHNNCQHQESPHKKNANKKSPYKGSPQKDDIYKSVYKKEKSAQEIRTEGIHKQQSGRDDVLLKKSEMHEQLRKSNSTDEIEKDTKLQDPTSETNFGISESSMLCPVRPLYTIIFDAINRHIGRIGPQASVYRNISIKKEMVNYGCLSSYVPILQLLRQNCCQDSQLYECALNEYLSLLKHIFLNKIEAIEQANRIGLFHMLCAFFWDTRMAGFGECLVSSLKEIYISLNTRMIREKFLRELIWELPAGEFLSEPHLDTYLRFVKSFYNEDIQSCLSNIGIKQIMDLILARFDRPNCCLAHAAKSSLDGLRGIDNYALVLSKYFSVVENILLLKRNNLDLPNLVGDIINMFSVSSSACFTQELVNFIQGQLRADVLFEKVFIECMQSSRVKMSIYAALAYSSKERTRSILVSLILEVFGHNIVKDVHPFEKDLIGMCIRYPMMASRSSSVKSELESVDVSEDRLSLNSTNRIKFATIKLLGNVQQTDLLGEEHLVNIIWEWSLSPQVLETLSEDNQHPGVSILAEVYKASTYHLRKQITALLLQNLELLRFTPDFMAWITECLLVCECDSTAVEPSKEETIKVIETTKRQLIELICSYRIAEAQSNEDNELYIIKLVLASVKKKYPQEVARLSCIVLLLISEEMINGYIAQLADTLEEGSSEREPVSPTLFSLEKGQAEQEAKSLDRLCVKATSNLYRCLLEYFSSREGEEFEFEEESVEQDQKEASIVLRILDKFYQLLINLASPRAGSLMAEANATRNRRLLELLFPVREDGDVSLMCFLFVALQMVFQCFEDLNISQRKLLLTLVKKYLILVVQISENSSGSKLDRYQQELQRIFLNTLGFLENKFFQYYSYVFDKHKNLEYSVQNRIRRNIEDIRKTLLGCFIQLIEVMKHIDQVSSMQHKSFYDLMKPKKKLHNEVHLKNFYPALWRKADEKIIQFMYLSVDTLRQQAREKLETHLLQKRLSAYSSEIEKSITKHIEKFVAKEKQRNQGKEKQSVVAYTRKESEKCRILIQFQEQITVLMYEMSNRNVVEERTRKLAKESMLRQMRAAKQQVWNFNRTFPGLWENLKFYQYSQADQNKQNIQELSRYYRRVRSERQSKYSLSPFISVFANPLDQEEQCQQEIYFEDRNKEQEKVQSSSKSKSQKYLKIGIQFIKKRVIEKILKSSLLNKDVPATDAETSCEAEEFVFRRTLLVVPMKVFAGIVKINQTHISFQHQPSHEVQHLSLLKNRQTKYDHLVERWPLLNIECYQLKKFLLRLNSLEIFFRDRTSIFLCFGKKSDGEQSLNRFIELLGKFRKIQWTLDRIPPPLRQLDPYRCLDHCPLTDSWRNREISNLQYLMGLNILSGRTNCDLNQYFVIPWVLADYDCRQKETISLRDLERNMGSCGTQERIDKFVEIKNVIEQNHKEEFIQPHFFGFHYSNIAIVLQYLVRVYPYAEGAIQMQGGKFDIPDRLFMSVAESYRNATTEMSDVRELIPEFFYFPELLLNTEHFDFGMQQNQRRVHDVQLPSGFSNAYDFIEYHRQVLESEDVSSNLHKWIDLIFGYKQYGREAELACNKFHYLAYENNLPFIFSEDKPDNRESVESQMAYFGKVPSQLFSKPHPRRLPANSRAYSSKYTRTNLFAHQQMLSPIQESQLINHRKGFFSLAAETPILLSYSALTRKFLALRRDWRGLIFSAPREEGVNRLNAPTQSFNFFLDKFENVYIFDERVYFRVLPICSLWSQHLFFGGLWGGKILKYDIKKRWFQCYTKHSQTVTALAVCEQLQVIVSGTLNGEIAVWELSPRTLSNSQNGQDQFRKLIFRDKAVPHYDCINSITVHADLRVAICSSQDASISVIDIEKCRVMRVIRLKSPVQNALLLSYPYYHYFINCERGQYSYSLNGQYLASSQYDDLCIEPCLCLFQGCKEKVVIKQQGRNYFSLLKMPYLLEEFRLDIKNEDSNVLQFWPIGGETEVEIVFSTKNHFVCCSEVIQRTAIEIL